MTPIDGREALSSFDEGRIRDRITRAAEEELPQPVASEIAFHMTDWLVDLEALAAFCSDPESSDDEQVRELMRRFLIHVPNHVAAAAKLYVDIPVTDVFGVGATTQDQE